MPLQNVATRQPRARFARGLGAAPMLALRFCWGGGGALIVQHDHLHRVGACDAALRPRARTISTATGWRLQP
ncbi:hypothetical protein N9L68_01925 [bacterium]|nr:hypothetical protein [bacterium]